MFQYHPEGSDSRTYIQAMKLLYAGLKRPYVGLLCNHGDLYRIHAGLLRIRAHRHVCPAVYEGILRRIRSSYPWLAQHCNCRSINDHFVLQLRV